VCDPKHILRVLVTILSDGLDGSVGDGRKKYESRKTSSLLPEHLKGWNYQLRKTDC
jgi:hypothetical protein